MTNGSSKQNKDALIASRIYLVDNIESIIKESIYYRSNSDNFDYDNKNCLGNIKEQILRKKIL